MEKITRRNFLRNSLLLSAGLLPLRAFSWVAPHMRRSSVDRSFLGMMSSLGINGNLLVCLDAGDLNSYNGSSQEWTNLAPGGLGTSFYRGSTSSAEASDPTFVGQFGSLSSNEYFLFDGNDSFTEKTAGWGDDKFLNDGAKFTIGFLVYVPASIPGEQRLLNNFLPPGPSQNASTFSINANGTIMQYSLVGGNTVKNVSSTAKVSLGSWNFVAWSVNENGGATAGTFVVNEASQTFNPSYSATYNANSSTTARLGADGSGQTPVVAGVRMAGVFIWNRSLSAAELLSLRTKIKSNRFPSLP